MSFFENIQNTTQKESAVSGVDGWLFTDFWGRDSLTASILHLSKDNFSSRRWVYIVFARETAPLKILHSIEDDFLCHLPAGTKKTYSSQKEFEAILKELAGLKFAVLYDSNIPAISTVDGGFLATLKKCGIKTLSAKTFVQRCVGILSPAGIDSHERSSSLLHGIIADTWDFITQHYKTATPLTEGKTATFILNQFIQYNLTTDHAPIVAFGKNTGNPHYQVPLAGGATAKPGDVIQLDIWAKEKIASDEKGVCSSNNAIYADISWVGIFGSPSLQQQTMFEAIKAARNKALIAINEAVATNKEISGLQIDKIVRQEIDSLGYGSLIRHRTGHGIDTKCHGYGVNLDSVEFPDDRNLLIGSCVSIEPGIYTAEYGMRTEIDLYIDYEGKPVVSGQRFNSRYKNRLPEIPQKQLLTTEDF
ncbi:MAG: aminopeptidase P family protein [Spirochaetaceae bacterium]|nr:aminopeptidase P family protein [Spirochaetaceae bacterium]